MWKCIFVRLVIQFPFGLTKPCLTYSVVSTRGLSASATLIAYSCKAYYQKFSRHKNSHKYKSSISLIFCTFCCRHANRYLYRMDWNSLYWNLRAITIAWIVPKTTTFQGTFSYQKPALLQQPYTKRYFLCSDGYYSHAAFVQTLILYPFAHLLFTSITSRMFSPKRFRFSFTSLALYSLVRFCKRLSKPLNLYQRLFQIAFPLLSQQPNLEPFLVTIHSIRSLARSLAERFNFFILLFSFSSLAIFNSTSFYFNALIPW